MTGMTGVTGGLKPPAASRARMAAARMGMSGIDEVVDGVFISDFESAFRADELARRGITHVLNVAREINVTQRVDMAYRKLGVPDDDPDYDVGADAPVWAAHIRAVRAAHGRVLVHCWEGRSRAACAVLAYLVLATGADVDAALRLIARKRTVALDVFPQYLRQLRGLTGGGAAAAAAGHGAAGPRT